MSLLNKLKDKASAALNTAADFVTPPAVKLAVDALPDLRPAKEKIVEKLSTIGGKISAASPAIKSVADTWVDAFTEKTAEGQEGYVARETIKNTPKALKQVALGVKDSIVRDVPKSMIAISKAAFDNLSSTGSAFDKLPGNENNAAKRAEISNAFEDMLNVFDEKDAETLAQFDGKEFIDPENFGYQVGRGGGSLLLAVGTAVATKNPAIGADVLGSMQGSNTYLRAQEKLRADKEAELGRSLTPEEEGVVTRRASAAAITDGVVGAKLEKIGIDYLFSSNTVAKKALAEVVQEVTQQFASNVIERLGFNKDKGIFEDLAETAFITLPIGAGGGLATNLSAFREKMKTDLKMTDAEVDQALPEIQEAVAATRDSIKNEAEAAVVGSQARKIAEQIQKPAVVAIDPVVREGVEEIATQFRKREDTEQQQMTANDTIFSEEEQEAFNANTHYPLDYNKEYKNIVDSFENEITSKFGEEIPAEVNSIIEEYRKNAENYLRAKGKQMINAPSPFVTGRAGYNFGKADKAIGSYENASKGFFDYAEGARSKIDRIYRNLQKTEYAALPEQEKIQRNIEKLTQQRDGLNPSRDEYFIEKLDKQITSLKKKLQKFDTLEDNQDNKIYGTRADKRSKEPGLSDDGQEVRSDSEGSAGSVERGSNRDRMEAAGRLAEYYGEDGESARLVVEQSDKIDSGESVTIDEYTPNILRSFGFSDSLVATIERATAQGLVSKVAVAEDYDGDDFVSAFINDTIYLNPKERNTELYQKGHIADHELFGHAWYTKINDEERQTFFEAMKADKETVLRVWQESDNSPRFYWQETIDQLARNIQNATQNQATTDRIVNEFGLIYDSSITLESFIDQSLNIDKTISAINAELRRIGKDPIDLKAHNTVAVREHNAMIAEKANVLESNNSVLDDYIGHVVTGSLDPNKANIQVLAPVYEGNTDLTSKTLEKLKKRKTVSKQFISDLTNVGDIKQAERETIRDVLDEYGNDDKIPVQEFADKVTAQLLPLDRSTTADIENTGEDTETQFENVTLPEEIRGDVADYTEHVYESPIQTRAGNVHFDSDLYPSYFAHSRIEDMADGETRRVIELQSDLFQKGRLENEAKNVTEDINRYRFPGQENIKKAREERLTEISKLEPYRNTWQDRLIREEVRQAAKDGKIKLLFPTGETAMKIEGLGQRDTWVEIKNGKRLDDAIEISDLKVGKEINRIGQGDTWVITDILGDGKFKAVRKGILEIAIKQERVQKNGEIVSNEEDAVRWLRENNSVAQESFDISGKVDTENPIYRFYEKEVARYLKNKYGATQITDDKGVTWNEVKITPDMAVEPIIAFRKKERNPIFNTGNKLDDVRAALAYVEERTGVKPIEMIEEDEGLDTPAIDAEYTAMLKEGDKELADEVKAVRETKVNKADIQNEIELLKLESDLKKEGLVQDAAKKLSKYTNKKTGELPEVTGKAGRKVVGEFARRGDDIVTELGFKDSEEARRAYEAYVIRRKEFLETKDYISQRVKNFREKKSIIEAVEKQLRAEGRGRKQKIDAIQEFFKLTDKEMKMVVKGNPDYRLISEEQFNDLLKAIQGKAYETLRLREARLAVEYTIFNKELRKIDNIRQALKMRELENMTVGELDKFNELLETYQQGDEFLGKRQIQTVRKTDLGDIATHREAREALAREAGVPIEELEKVRVDSMDKFLYDIALARKNPLYKVMVDNVSRSTVEAGIRYHEIKNKTEDLINAARKSRARSFFDRLVPTDQMIFDYLEADAPGKIEFAARMTAEELKAALYIQETYAQVRDYLIEQETLKKYRSNYITHVRRSFLEAFKENNRDQGLFKGLVGAVKEIFESYQQEQAYFNILDAKTGEVLPLEKFFKFSMQRSGNLVPSKNVAKAFLAYMQTYEKKRQLDSFIPKLDIFAHVLTSQEMTSRGLIKNDTLQTFVKKWLNTKKGRAVDTAIANPGDRVDWFLRSGIAFTRLLDLGLNIPVGLASNLGAQTAVFVPLGTKNYTIGVKRSYTKKGKEIIKKYEGMIGESFISKMHDASRDIGDKFTQGIYGLFSIADRKAKATFLLGSMTKEEFEKGELSPDRAKDVRNEIGRYLPTDGMESIIGKTSVGAVFKQYKTWAIPIMHTNIDNIKKVSAMVKAGQNPFATREGKELFRTTIVLTSLILLSYGAYTDLRDKKNRTFLEQLAFKSMNDAMSILGAMDPSLWTKIRLAGFLDDLSTSMTNIVSSLTTGDRTQDGEIRGLSQFTKTLTPATVKQLTKDTSSSELDELLRDQDAAADEYSAQAQEKWAEIKKIREEQGNEAANAAFEKLQEKDETLADKVYNIGIAETRNLSDVEKKINRLGVTNGERARYIYGEILKLKTKEEKNAYAENLSEKGIISDEVYDQISDMVQSEAMVYEDGEEVSKQGTINDIYTYARAIGVDPLVAFDRIFTGQRIRRIDNKTIIVERLPLSESAKIKRERGAVGDMRLDHTVPLQLGGGNGKRNLNLVTYEQWQSYTPVENYLGKQLRAGKINKRQAKRLIKDFKAGKITAEDVHNAGEK